MSVDSKEPGVNPWPVAFPLSEITPYPPVQITGSNIIANIPHFFPQLYEENGYNSHILLSACTLPIPLQDIDPEMPVEQLLVRQRSARFPSKAVVPLRQYRTLEHSLPHYDRETGKSRTMVEFYGDILEALGQSRDLAKADLQKPELTGMIEPHINVLAALKLINNPEARAQFPAVADIATYCRDQAVPFSPDALRTGFVQLLNASTLRNLQSTGYLAKDATGRTMKDAAFWLAELGLLGYRLDAHNHRKRGSYHMPYPTDFMNDNIRPPIAALPHILSAQVMYIADLPEQIPSGGFYPIETAIMGLNHTDRFARSIIRNAVVTRIQKEDPSFVPADMDMTVMMERLEQIDPAMVKRMRLIQGEYNKVAAMAVEFIDQYRRDPRLLNKTGKNIGTANVPFQRLVNGWYQFLQRSYAAGGEETKRRFRTIDLTLEVLSQQTQHDQDADEA